MGAFETYIDDYLHHVIKRVELFGVDRWHDPYVSLFRTSSSYLELRIKSSAENRQLASVIAYPPYTTPLLRLPLTGEGATIPFTGSCGIVELDVGAIVESASVYQPATFAEAGLKRSGIHDFDQVRGYFDRREFAEVIRAGPARAFTTLRAAVESLYDAPLANPDGINVWPWCARATPLSRILVLLDAGIFNATNLHLPDNVSLRGAGRGKTIIRKESDSPRPLIQGHFSHYVADLTLHSDTSALLYGNPATPGQYAWHADINNLLNGGDSNGDVNFQINQLFENVDFIGGPDQNVALYGGGASGASRGRFKNCRAWSENTSRTAPFFSLHTTQNMLVPAAFVFEDCIDRHGSVSSVAVQSEQPYTASPSEVVINGCPTFSNVALSGTVAGAWIGLGDYQGATQSNIVGDTLEFST